MRTLTAAMALEMGLTVTKPGYLVQILFDTYTVRLSSFGDVNWNGSPWIGAIIAAGGLTWEPSGFIAGGQLRLGNLDGAMGALVLQHDVADRPITIWLVYAGALAAGDPVMVFDGVGDETTVDLRQVGISLAIAGSRALYSPRECYSPAAGFNHLPPIGEEVTFNGDIFKLDRAEY